MMNRDASEEDSRIALWVVASFDSKSHGRSMNIAQKDSAHESIDHAGKKNPSPKEDDGFFLGCG
jgi:hypothetical protein